MVDHVGPPAEALDAEVGPRTDDGVIDLRAVGERAAQLVGKGARHADPADLGRLAVDVRGAEAQEADVAQVLPVARSRVCSEVGPAIWNR